MREISYQLILLFYWRFVVIITSMALTHTWHSIPIKVLLNIVAVQPKLIQKFFCKCELVGCWKRHYFSCCCLSHYSASVKVAHIGFMASFSIKLNTMPRSDSTCAQVQFPFSTKTLNELV